jgi:hypothetical protein
MIPKQRKALGLGCIDMEQGENLDSALEEYTTAFQAEVHDIKAYQIENLGRDYKNRNIYILSDSQAATKALFKYQLTSKLVWDFHQSLIQLARHNRVYDSVI